MTVPELDDVSVRQGSSDRNGPSHQGVKPGNGSLPRLQIHILDPPLFRPVRRDQATCPFPHGFCRADVIRVRVRKDEQVDLFRFSPGLPEVFENERSRRQRHPLSIRLIFFPKIRKA